MGQKIFLCLLSWGLLPFSSSPTAHFFKFHSSWHMHYLLRMLNLHIFESACLKMLSAASPPLGLASDTFTNSLHFVAFQSRCFLCWESIMILFQGQIHCISVGRDHCKALFSLLRVCVQHSVMQIYTSIKGPSHSSLVARGQPVWPSLPRLVPVSCFLSLQSFSAQHLCFTKFWPLPSFYQ